MALQLDGKVRIAGIDRVIRVYNGRKTGESIQYSDDLPSHELIFKWSGGSISTVGGVEHALFEGSILYIPKGNNGGYSVKTLRQGESIDICCQLEEPLSDVPVLLPPPHRPAVRELFEQCHAIWRMGSDNRELKCMGLTYELLAELQDERSARVLTDAGQRALDVAVQHLGAHYADESVDYEALARQAGVSYSYLKKLFLRRMGMPPSRYVMLRRMEAARDLLQATEESVTDISRQLGYSSVYYFSRAFHKETGMTPTQYREQMR